MRKLWPLLVATTLAFAVLCSLGTWQMFRLAEKNKLIAVLEARLNAEPISLASALDRQAKGENLEYLKVFATGSLNTAKALAKISSYNGNAGWQIIVPLTTDDGIFVLVDAGTAIEKTIAPITQNTLTGIIRLHKQGRGFFDNDNDAATNTWYWWDIPEMLSVAVDPAATKVANGPLALLLSLGANSISPII